MLAARGPHLYIPWKALTMLPAAHIETDTDVWQPTPDEWKAYIEAGLARLGLTYEQLSQQARERSFQSADAMNFWVIIGDSTK